jgi:hypothetical protein
LEKAGEQLLAAAAVLVLQRPEHKGRLHCAALAPEAKLPFCPSALLLAAGCWLPAPAAAAAAAAAPAPAAAGCF